MAGKKNCGCGCGSLKQIIAVAKKEEKKTNFKSKGDLIERLEEVLPFSLTNSQKKVLNKIKEDMTSHHRMMRLLHGEVGSGKTVIALGAMLRGYKFKKYKSKPKKKNGAAAETNDKTLKKIVIHCADPKAASEAFAPARAIAGVTYLSAGPMHITVAPPTIACTPFCGTARIACTILR